MNAQAIKVTPVWELYEKGRNYHRMVGIYTDTDRNYRMFNGNQWEGLKLGGVEPVQKNFIKPIVKYKCAVLHDNLYAINYSSLNFENRLFRSQAERICELLNGYAARVWERDKLDDKLREITRDAAVNDEGVIYIDFDVENMLPVTEVVKKNDIYYGNENDDDIQAQPYILIRKRMAKVNAIDLALSFGMSEDMTEFIIGDNDTFEESGEAAKKEVDNNVTVVYKFYREGGTVRFSVATRWVTIVEDEDTGLTLYPIVHFNWEKKEGSARGEGEVRYLIPNQIEVNRTEMRRVLTVKNQAYPHKVVNVTKVRNPSALNTAGGTVETHDQTVEDVRKIVGTIPPAQMSPDVVKLQEDMIQITRELAGAGDAAVGDIDPEAASGRAILAVQQAQRAPMGQQRESLKSTIEDMARVFLEYLTVHSVNGVKLEEEYTDPSTGQNGIQLVTVPQAALMQLQAVVKVDITPRSVFDKFAQEQTIENLLVGGLLTPQRVGELEVYANLLPDDAVAPKLKILEGVDRIKDEQRRIAAIEAQAQMLEQRAEQ
ncbi:MAG: hypothetical protein IKW68_03615, partial [Clostridia bacterium]|nr:hypothetical protein [Clostridia bacterium]